MLEELKLPAVVLSYGRAGSVLTAHNIARKLGTLPIYIKNSSATEYVIGHSHLLPDSNIVWPTRIFCIRNCLDSALSFILAKDQHTFHKWANEDQEPVAQEVDPLVVRSHLLQYKIWHKQYADTLCPADSVVVYEKLKSVLGPNQVYRPTFPNKTQLVLNYDTVVSVCADLIAECEQLTNVFAAHTNPLDIYQLAAD